MLSPNFKPLAVRRRTIHFVKQPTFTIIDTAASVRRHFRFNPTVPADVHLNSGASWILRLIGIESMQRKHQMLSVGIGLTSKLQGTFGPEGPTKCSGLNVVRYDADTLHAEFGVPLQVIGELERAAVLRSARTSSSSIASAELNREQKQFPWQTKPYRLRRPHCCTSTE